MVDLGILLSWFPCIFLFFFTFLFFFYKTNKSASTSTSILPKSYPLIVSCFTILANRDRHNQWAEEVLAVCPTNTYVLRYPGTCMVFTAYPENVKHIVKSHFSNYPKGAVLKNILSDFFGNGNVNADGDRWKFQRQLLLSHEFNPTSLRKFFEEVVKVEIFQRLIHVLSMAAENNSELDLQDIFQRFAFDTICKKAFGYDPSYFSPSREETEFTAAFEDANRITSERVGHVIPLVWKLKRFLNIGSGKILKQAIATIRESIRKIVRQKKHELKEKSFLETTDVISRIVKDHNVDEELLIDISINFIVGGLDTISAALTWFFWLVCSNPEVETEILKEINQTAEEPGYDDVKDMVYIHASLCETMRLYPPVPVESKEAASDDILADGTIITKGMMVLYSSYAMGRMENLWGSDWNEFKPGRWLERKNVTGKLIFVGKDPYTYPVFHAGPRICLGKEMAFLEIKMVAAEILRRFKVVPVAKGDDFAPVFVSYVTAKMKDGFPVKIEKRTT
ncbi:cytochrome P450 94A1-like [Papaver somniferum]|uniref:cytochrome P450 94A1-like n=1 Tax=Papaver somniferum TaxID=3469 RepID=UPI000E700D42|nr:cytochrome P450 94A1-like [Papaver somniferum]